MSVFFTINALLATIRLPTQGTSRVRAGCAFHVEINAL